MAKWSVFKWRCRQNYRDGCRPVWIAVSPNEDDWFHPEFDSWVGAMAYVNRELAAAGLGQPQ